MSHLKILFILITFSLIYFNCSSLTINSLVSNNTKKMLSGYRGSTGMKVAVLKSGEIEKNSETVSTDIMNSVTQTLFNDGRFIIVERELLKKILDEISLQQSGLMSEKKISEIGKLSGAQLILIVRQNSDIIDIRIIAVETGEVQGFTSFSTDEINKSGETKISNYDKLKNKYLNIDCGKQSRQQKEMTLVSFNSYPEDKRELYLLSVIQSCEANVGLEKKRTELSAKIKELNLDKKSSAELEQIFINKDSTMYPSKATRKMLISQLKKSLLVDSVKKSPSMKEYYTDIYKEQLIGFIANEGNE